MSNYGPKRYGQYTDEDNARRKSNNTNDVVEAAGANCKVKMFHAKASITSQWVKDQRIRELNKKQPVKIYTPEEIKALEESLKKAN